MKAILNTFHRCDNLVTKKEEAFACKHNFLTFLITFTVMPLLIIGGVAGGTFAIGFPLAWICGLL